MIVPCQRVTISTTKIAVVGRRTSFLRVRAKQQSGHPAARRSRWYPSLFVGFWSLCWTGCAIHPLTQTPRMLAMNPAEEVRVGEQLASEMRNRHGVVEPGALTDYVRQLGSDLASAAPGPAFQYQFDLLDTPVPNAVAFPGGQIQVTRGLLALLDSKDELAGVLGHEISHAALEHAAERLVLAVPLGILADIVSAPVGLLDKNTAHRFRDNLSRVVIAPYDREREREADRCGAAIVASWGFQPAGLATALTALASAQPNAKTGWLATHPPTEKRVATIHIYDQFFVRGEQTVPAGSPADFLELLDGLVVGPNVQAGVFIDETTFVIPESGLVFSFPTGWTTSFQGREAVAMSPDAAATLTLTTLAEPFDFEATLADAHNDAVAIPLPTLVNPFEIEIHRAVVIPPDAPTSRWRLWWFGFHGHYYQLSAFATSDLAPDIPAQGDTMTMKLQPLDAASLCALRVDRLRLVQARAGETLAALVERTDSVWSVAEMTRVNRLSSDEPLKEGRSIKIARREPYRCPSDVTPSTGPR